MIFGTLLERLFRVVGALGRSWGFPKALLVDLGLVFVDLGSSWTLVGRFFMESAGRACHGHRRVREPA